MTFSLCFIFLQFLVCLFLITILTFCNFKFIYCNCNVFLPFWRFFPHFWDCILQFLLCSLVTSAFYCVIRSFSVNILSHIVLYLLFFLQFWLFVTVYILQFWCFFLQFWYFYDSVCILQFLLFTVLISSPFTSLPIIYFFCNFDFCNFDSIYIRFATTMFFTILAFFPFPCNSHSKSTNFHFLSCNSDVFHNS